MQRLWGLIVFVVLVSLVAGVSLAQTSQQGDGDKLVDRPVTKAGDTAGDGDEEEDDDFPEPPPFFGEDGNAGEKMKIVWCLDRSGSMRLSAGTFTGADGQPMTGTRWDRAVAETTIALSQLTPEWEFGIVTYACGRDEFSCTSGTRRSTRTGPRLSCPKATCS